uniref:Uncharacterized protein n=1 Tax=Anguilla anguilla TaxID=7936 RepID=A0A0E9WU22_ANGAN
MQESNIGKYLKYLTLKKIVKCEDSCGALKHYKP